MAKPAKKSASIRGASKPAPKKLAKTKTPLAAKGEALNRTGKIKPVKALASVKAVKPKPPKPGVISSAPAKKGRKGKVSLISSVQHSKENEPMSSTASADSKSKSAFPKSFLDKQRQVLFRLRDDLVDTMGGVARGNLREHAEGSEASAYGMHQGDAGSDAYDRDLALNLLSQEQDALYEIQEALARIDNGSYGICEMSGEKIPQERLEAIPFARMTVQCQSQLEKEMKIHGRANAAAGPLFKRAKATA